MVEENKATTYMEEETHCVQSPDVEEQEEVLNKSEETLEPTDFDKSTENSEGHGKCAQEDGIQISKRFSN